MKISLKERSQFINAIRNELNKRGLIEVDAPNFMVQSGYDRQNESFHTRGKDATFHIHNSPELYLKHLLISKIEAAQSGLFYLGHVFRDDPKTFYHRKEFMMAEWYRPNLALEDLKQDSLQIIEALGGNENFSEFFIQQNFEFNINEEDDLEDFLLAQSIRIPPDSNYEDFFSLLWLHFIEEKIKAGLWVVNEFPARLRSMSKLNPKNSNLCLRFEICINGIEIANAYEEETNSSQILPSNHFLFKNLSKLKLCSGIALGVDRLMCALGNHKTINEVMYPLIDLNNLN